VKKLIKVMGYLAKVTDPVERKLLQEELRELDTLRGKEIRYE
jgi:hypothetical protein